MSTSLYKIICTSKLIQWIVGGKYAKGVFVFSTYKYRLKMKTQKLGDKVIGSLIFWIRVGTIFLNILILYWLVKQEFAKKLVLSFCKRGMINRWGSQNPTRSDARGGVGEIFFDNILITWNPSHVSHLEGFCESLFCTFSISICKI